jgi:protein SCO1/2
MRIKWFGLLVMLMMLAACTPYQFMGTEYPEGIPADDFTLTDTEGRPYQFSNREGKITLLFWGYTSCPDVCPVTLSEAKQLILGLGDEAEQVEFLFITVDPERDTPEVLQKYTAAFHPDITGLTGTPEELTAVQEAYGIYAAKVPLENSAAGYSMDHSARVFLVDGDGRLRLSYAYGTPADDIVQDVRYLLK